VTSTAINNAGGMRLSVVRSMCGPAFRFASTAFSASFGVVMVWVVWPWAPDAIHTTAWIGVCRSGGDIKGGIQNDVTKTAGIKLVHSRSSPHRRPSRIRKRWRLHAVQPIGKGGPAK